jgi:phospholipid-translocating ATPase
MLLWIVVYSYFQSSDFNEEVVVLFGELTFWATVVFSVLVALSEFDIVFYCMLSILMFLP